ncbi:T4 family baseplate hub assembly chaperone [Streptomyces nigrescens]
MTVTGPAELLATWEAGLSRQGGDRALLLHRAARPGTGTDALLSVPPGERAADLFALRRALFGERLQITLDCTGPDCAAAMEFELDAAELGARPRVPEDGLRVAEGDWTVVFRLPSVADLTAVASLAADAEEARRLLGARCARTARRGGRAATDEELAALPEAVLKRFAEAAERADPAAEVVLTIACPECGAATPAELDIAAYLWTELDVWARDVLLDVHLLASAYGWSEPQILALSPLRRRYYLELCADA